ncbi:MAG TPA: cation:proton antiporter [Ilumatobacteraceae bacterium]|nr:cation:proton antiporter [Ilumatobacteraceae bacterium]
MDFGSLALVVAAGLMGPLFASAHRFAPPVLVGEVVAGVVIGTSGFSWVDPDEPVLNGLALIGFALLMFIVGTHLPVRDLRLRSALSIGVALAATVSALAVVAGFVLAPVVGLHRPGIIAVVLATSSGAVALPVLQSTGDAGRTWLVTTAWIAVADIGTVLALPLVLATGGLARVVSGGALVVGAGVVMLAIAEINRERAWVQRVRRYSHDRGWGLDLRISLLALFVCAWLANRFGSSILIAGFTVGIVVAVIGEPRRVAQQLVGIGEGFAIPLFFVHLGAQIDLGALLDSPRALALAGALSVVGIAIHVLAAVSWGLPVGMGLIAAAQLGVPVAVVSIGLASKQLSAAQGAAVMASLLVTLGACAIGSAILGDGGSLTDASAPVERG